MFLVITRSPRRVEHFPCLSRRNLTVKTQESEKEIKREKILKFFSLLPNFHSPIRLNSRAALLCFFFNVGLTCPFIPLLSPFQPRNKLFCPGFNFIYSNCIFFKYFSIFRNFSKIPFSCFTLNTGLEFRKIFQLSQNLTKIS